MPYCKQSQYVAYLQQCLNVLLIKDLISAMLWFYHANKLRGNISMPALYNRLDFWASLWEKKSNNFPNRNKVLFQTDKTANKKSVLHV